MCAIAERPVFGVLALAESVFAALLNFKGHGLDASTFMRTVAEWLVLGAAAGAPPIFLAFFQVLNRRFQCSDLDIIHKFIPQDLFDFYDLLSNISTRFCNLNPPGSGILEKLKTQVEHESSIYRSGGYGISDGRAPGSCRA